MILLFLFGMFRLMLLGSVRPRGPTGDGSGVVGRPYVATFQSANEALLIAICLTIRL